MGEKNDKPVNEERRVVGENLDRVLAIACRKQMRMKIAAGPDHFPFYIRFKQLLPDEIYLCDMQPTTEQEEEQLLVDSDIDVVFPLDRREHFAGRLMFKGRLDNLSGPLLYRIDRPRELLYIIKRRNERMAPTEGLPAACLSIGDKHTNEDVVVKNISADGIGLLLADERPAQPGMIFPPLKLKLSANIYLTLTAQVRHVTKLQTGGLYLGLMWEPMSKRQYEALFSYLSNLAESHRRSE